MKRLPKSSYYECVYEKHEHQQQQYEQHQKFQQPPRENEQKKSKYAIENANEYEEAKINFIRKTKMKNEEV